MKHLRLFMGLFALMICVTLHAKKGDIIKDTLDATYKWVINYQVLTENASTKKGTVKYQLYLGSNAGRSKIGQDSLVIPDKFTYNNITYTVTQIGIVHLLNTIKYIYIPSTITKIENANFDSNYNSNPKVRELEISDLTKYLKIATNKRMYAMNNQDFYNTANGSESALLWSFKEKYENGTFTPTQFKVRGDTLTNLTIPSGITKINDALFHGCGSLKKLTVPEGVTEIGAWSFSCCANLEEITLPSTLTKIGSYAFLQCINLNKINWSNHPTNLIIGSGAFQGCISLTEDPLFEGVTSLGHSAFKECIGIKKVNLPLSLTIVNEGCFSACQFDQFEFPQTLTNLSGVSSDLPNVRVFKIPNSVKKIGYAFRNSTSLSHLTLPTHIESFELTSIGLSVLNHPYRNTYTYNGNIPYRGHPNFKDFTDWNSVRGPITEVTFPKGVNVIAYRTYYDKENYTPKPNLHSVFVMGDTITEKMLGDGLTVYVKKSVFDEKYSDGKIKAYMEYEQGGIGAYAFGESDTKENIEVPISYKIPLSMTNAAGNPIEYKTLCRDFDVDLTHTNDNLPEGVEPLRAYVVEDVDGDLRMVFMNEIKYIPSRLKANVTDENGNLYQGVDEYVGVILRGTPGYTYYYEMGEHDYTQGASGQWLMDDAMAYSNASFEQNLMAGDANDDFYVHKVVEDEDNNETVNYGLNNGRFKIYNKNGWLNYNKSYLKLPKNVSEAIEGAADAEGNVNLTFMFNNSDGSTDKISSAEFMKNAESDIFYNPYGQRVSKDTKGIVINNGKKFVNK